MIMSKVAEDKAYKVLAEQEGISNSKAKELIDKGLVYVGNRKVVIARGNVSLKTKFRIEKIEKVKVIYENNDMIVVDKPAFLSSEEIEKQFKGARLLHRLDRETSGVLVLCKDEEFRLKAIEEFKHDRVYKEYIAWVDGDVIEEFEIDKPILTEKHHNKAKSKISASKGKPARTEVFPLMVVNHKSKIKLVIHQGRTHQIRVHLRSENLPIIGDELYGGRRAKRMMLHAHKMRLLDKEFVSPEPKEYKHIGGGD